MRILVVEDEAIVGRDIQASLARCGHTVKHVLQSGEAALEHLDNEVLPDLVVMDIGLAGAMDGIETGAAIRERHSVPVLFLSAMSDEATLNRAKEAGAYGYLLKPFNELELHSMVEVAAARHASEQKLKATSARHLGTLTSIANAVLATDLIGRITFLNPAAETITGWTAADAQGRYVHEVFKISYSSGEAVGVGDDPVGNTRSVMLTTRGGALLPIEDNTTPLRNSEGSLCGLVILFRLRGEDSDEDNAARTLETSTGDELTTWAQLAGMVTGIAAPIIAVDPQWKITYVNEPAGSLLHKPRRELFSVDFWSQFPKSAHSRYYQRLHQALVRNEPAEFDLHLDALALWFQARCYPFANGLLILLTDITARKTADEQKSKLDKLESLGYLARGFAHDFNNLLTVLLGNLSIAGMRAPTMPRTAPRLTKRNARLYRRRRSCNSCSYSPRVVLRSGDALTLAHSSSSGSKGISAGKTSATSWISQTIQDSPKWIRNSAAGCSRTSSSTASRRSQRPVRSRSRCDASAAHVRTAATLTI